MKTPSKTKEDNLKKLYKQKLKEKGLNLKAIPVTEEHAVEAISAAL